MKRVRGRQNVFRPGDSDHEDSSESSFPVAGDESDTTFDTELTDSETERPAKKRHRADVITPVLEPVSCDDMGEFSGDPLDDTGIDLCEIPEDFDKAKGTIVRREGIKARWNRSVTQDGFNYVIVPYTDGVIVIAKRNNDRSLIYQSGVSRWRLCVRRRIMICTGS